MAEKETSIRVRVNTDEKVKLKHLAEEAHLSVSAYVRNQLLAGKQISNLGYKKSLARHANDKQELQQNNIYFLFNYSMFQAIFVLHCIKSRYCYGFSTIIR